MSKGSQQTAAPYPIGENVAQPKRMASKEHNHVREYEGVKTMKSKCAATCGHRRSNRR